MNRHVCIHGHFYQPPRENPWLEAIETQDGAAPYHDWNQRITAECYAANAASRILDEKLRIVDIVSNYSKISFDMGPTLLQWLEKNSPETYAAIIEADRTSVRERSGHGAAMAQAYNHIIMPLASKREKRTQVLWGIRDFKYRFGRDPEGMWLPETAVDLETLDIMSSMGIAFTVLAPHQARRVRKAGSKEWTDVSGAKVDPKVPYFCGLPSGKKISIFFYDGPISRAVAFERLLDSGLEFAKRLTGGFSESAGNQLVHIATDGESYGHHHRFGEMALSYALHHIGSNKLARVTNYGEFLAMNPPKHEVEIFENTSWSCAHGVERWRSDCGCNTGGQPRWRQGWRAPLREALDRLRDGVTAGYEKAAAKFFKDPWAAMDGYIGVILDRSDESIERFFGEYSPDGRWRRHKAEALRLMEMQRHAALMYTSCGWFFDDISGIEAVQVLQFAGRAIQLAREALGKDFEPEFTAALVRAKSNSPEHRDGARIYEKSVKSSVLDLRKVAAHYAINSVFEDYPEKASIYCYGIERADYRKTRLGTAVLVLGQCLIASQITTEEEKLVFCVLYTGNHDFNCAVGKFTSPEAYEKMKGEIENAFEGGALADVVRLLDAHFEKPGYSLKDLFRDEQRAILDILIKETIEGFEKSFRRMYDDNRPLMSFLKETGMPVPRAFHTAAEFILDLDLMRQLQGDFDKEAIHGILREFHKWNVHMDKQGLEFTLKNRIEEIAKTLSGNPGDAGLLEKLAEIVDIALDLPIRHNLWLPQNLYFGMARSVYPEFAARAGAGDKEAGRWVAGFKSLGENLNFNLEAVLPKA